MAYQFSTEPTATFKVKANGKSNFNSIKGISSTANAQTIVQAVSMFLAIADITGVYEGAERVKTDDVYDDGD